MDSHPPDKLAKAAAEEILRLIYGDDFSGCSVSLDAVATPIASAIGHSSAQDKEILGAYEEVFQALHLLSTPPDITKISSPAQLQSLLSDRLDAVHTLTTKTLDTIARLKAERSKGLFES